MKKALIGTNFKMYKGIAETTQYLKTLSELTADLREALTVFVIPSFTSLPAARESLNGTGILLGAQNMHPEEQGQFTGEISPLMLKELAIDIVEIGHSERRHVFGETDEEENLKVQSALEHGFIALLCIGETAEQKALGISDEMLRVQLKIGLNGVPAEAIERLWVAYEPVWAIGVHGVPAEPSYVQEKHRVIKETLEQLYPGKDIPVLYGGSVNPANSKELIVLDAVDGLFIGRSAWEAEKFNDLIRQILPLWKEKENGNR